MKKILFIFIAFFILSFVGGVFVWWNDASGPASGNVETVDFLVVKGRSASQIGEALSKEGLIKSPLAFKLYVQMTGRSDQIQAGEFRLSPSYSLQKTVETLSGPPLELWVTIPEGLRREEVVEKFIQGLEKSGTEASDFRNEFLNASAELEGYLFPDTYLFPREAKASTVVSAMRNIFDKRINEIERVKESKLTLEEVVILASIIERETRNSDERPVVAGILINRLDIGMGLQADATVQYALANSKIKGQNSKIVDWWVVPTLEDLKLDSPFNTYKYQGLPPSPIASPGLSSLKAALNPAKTDYIYYLHDTDGTIHYAETLEGHNSNIREFLGK